MYLHVSVGPIAQDQVSPGLVVVSKISVGEETATVLLAIVKFTLHKEPLRLDEHALMFGYKVSVVSNVWKYGRGDRAFVPHAVE
jgi:hypothetical protein